MARTAIEARAAGARAGVERLAALLGARRRTLVLTGAGCSTDAGIPDYRDRDGEWKRSRPIQYADFVRSERARRRYWSRSLAGWARVAAAEPGTAHRALARLERGRAIGGLVTQNVDGLHRRAGSERVIDLHGRLDAVECLGCGERSPRGALQSVLEALNPHWPALAPTAPDGDADVAGTEADPEAFRVPACEACGGVLKPTVVFFGESVPRRRVEAAFAWLAEADALLVAGSSLMVWSGYRFVRAARERAIPVAIVNLGRTRADAEADLKVEAPCGEVLAALAAAASGPGDP